MTDFRPTPTLSMRGRSDLTTKNFEKFSLLNGLRYRSEISLLFLNHFFTHKKNSDFSRPPLADFFRFFGFRNTFRAGGPIRPTFWGFQKGSEGSSSGQNHSKCNLLSPKTVYFSKISLFGTLLVDFLTTFEKKFWVGCDACCNERSKSVGFADTFWTVSKLSVFPCMNQY